jgi:H+-transporting ATPase
MTNGTEAQLHPGSDSRDRAGDSLEDTKRRLNTDNSGLNSGEVARRLEEYGYNELVEEKASPISKFLSYFWGPIPWMIEAAAILSAAVRHWADFVIVCILLVMNAIVGFWEEFQAGNAIEALKSHLALMARVKRDAKWSQVPARELVPGDVIRVRIGDIVPADAQLLETEGVEVDQSTLTGESLPVTRKTGEGVYSGSIIKLGETDAIVKATGARTYFGKTAKLVETAHSVSHFQHAILKIGDFLIAIALALVALIFVVALFRGDSIITTLEFALILTVAAVPVAMPAVLSVTMAVGARKLAKRQAIVSRLASIEEMAGIDVLCSDKTGTITKNELVMGEPYCVEGVKPEEVVDMASLASREEDRDPIDLAVLKGLNDESRIAAYTVTHFKPFDPVSKRTEASVGSESGDEFDITKGAPQVVLEMCENASSVEADVMKAVTDLAGRGYRSLGVARRDSNGSWRFLGVLPLYDPPRDDSTETIAEAKRLGLKVKLVTGDQIAIAKEIARQVGLGTNIQDAKAFEEARQHETSRFAQAIADADGFSQVYPEHKYHIVNVLQHEGHIVGMTGDGVNDAPALKQADAGIAVSGSTDAARAAADIVLLSPGLSTIVEAIRISRKIFKRMESYALYRIAETIRVLLFMTLSILVFNFYPVTAVMIVLLALLNDGPILAIAYDRTSMSPDPVAWRMHEVLGVSTAIGFAGVIASFGLFYLAERVWRLGVDAVQTFMFLKLAVAGHLTIFVTRTRGPFWSSRPSAALFWTAVVTKIMATVAAVYGLFMAPIGWRWAGIIWLYALAWFVVNDLVKRAAYSLLSHEKAGFAFGKRVSERRRTTGGRPRIGGFKNHMKSLSR